MLCKTAQVKVIAFTVSNCTRIPIECRNFGWKSPHDFQSSQWAVLTLYDISSANLALIIQHLEFSFAMK